MEDENELPYLVSRKSDYYEGYKGSTERKFNFENIAFEQFPSRVNMLILAQNHINRIIGSIDVKAKGCTCSIRQNDDDVRFSFNLKNQYMSSEFSAHYDMDNSEMIFNYPFTNFDGLKSLQWFKTEVARVEREIGLKFHDMAGGFDFKYDNGHLTINDEFDAIAHFSEGNYNSDSHGYKVDFENRKLKEYHVYDWIELYEPFR